MANAAFAIPVGLNGVGGMQLEGQLGENRCMQVLPDTGLWLQECDAKKGWKGLQRERLAEKERPGQWGPITSLYLKCGCWLSVRQG